MEVTRERMARYHLTKTPPIFNIGNLVMLASTNLKTRRPSHKLDHELHAPFTIIKVISPTAVRLVLPTKWRCPNTFHVSRVEPYRSSQCGLRPIPDLAEVLRQANCNGRDRVRALRSVLGSSWYRRAGAYMRGSSSGAGFRSSQVRGEGSGSVGFRVSTDG